MRVDYFAPTNAHRSARAVGADAARTQEEGFLGFCVSSTNTLDAFTSLTCAALSAPGLELGTSVVPVQTRHPLVLAQQALTLNQVTGGAFVLGIGLSHPSLAEGQWGIPYRRPTALMDEYLTILMSLLDHREADYEGEWYSMHGQVDVDGPRCRVLVAALGPRMLSLAAKLADGTLTWMVGPKTLREHTIPTLETSSSSAGRSMPEVVVGLPVCVTDDSAGARERLAAGDLAVYADLPSYRAMLEREGADHPVDLCLLGPPSEVMAGLVSYFEAGATRIVARPYGTTSEKTATREFLASLARSWNDPGRGTVPPGSC